MRFEILIPIYNESMFSPYQVLKYISYHLREEARMEAVVAQLFDE
jgi:hypothetical protein